MTRHAFRIERDVPATAERCYLYWSDPDLLSMWWGPKDQGGRPFVAHHVDWRPHSWADWCIGMRAPDGTEHWHEGEFLLVHPGRALEFTAHWVQGGVRGAGTRISMQVSGVSEPSRLSFVQAGFSDQSECDGHQEGWQECLDRLADCLGA